LLILLKGRRTRTDPADRSGSENEGSSSSNITYDTPCWRTESASGKIAALSSRLLAFCLHELAKVRTQWT